MSISWLLTAALHRYALHKKLLDIPNERSSHTIATPRGGGLAIVLTCLAGLLVLAILNGLTWSVLFAFLGAGILMALIGFIDDHGHIAPQWRLMAHFFAALWVLTWLGGLPQIAVFGEMIHPGWIGNTLGLIGLIWLVNLYNFMDGIDGLAASEAIFVAGAGLLFTFLGEQHEMQSVAVLLIASTLGFLIWNWPPAKIFMGDVGSGFLGMVLGIYAWWSVVEGIIPIWTWLILLGIFVVDATSTLIKRIFRGERWYEAHRSHAYQHASRRWGSHRKITMSVIIINMVWLLPLAWLATKMPIWGALFALIAYFPLLILAFYLRAGEAS